MTRTYNLLDLETADFDEGIVEIASTLVTLDAERNTTVGEPVWELFDPGVEISCEARAVHHIRDDQIEGKPQITPDRKKAFVDGKVHGDDIQVSVLVAHNVDFEQKFLADAAAGYPWICTYKAALRVWPEAPRHSNGVLYYWLRKQGLIPDLGIDAHPMHRAGPDTLITAHILAALLKRVTTREMIEWTTEPRLMSRCPIGDQWRDKPWNEVEHGFLTWIINKAGMDGDTVWNARREVERRAAARMPR